MLVYKPGSGGFGDIANSEAVVGGLLSCGKPQPISAFVSDEAAARRTETRLQSLTLSRKLTKADRLLSVIAANQLLVIKSFDVLILKITPAKIHLCTSHRDVLNVLA